MFTTFNDIARRLETGYANPSQRAGFGFDIDRAIENLDQAMEKVAELRATTGARLNTVSAQRATNEDANVNLQTLRSRLEDVDLTEAISILARETTALQAAQQSFVRVQGLTLFNFL
jgi:flagellar hook-associated protein 3 FlgL